MLTAVDVLAHAAVVAAPEHTDMPLSALVTHNEAQGSSEAQGSGGRQDSRETQGIDRAAARHGEQRTRCAP